MTEAFEQIHDDFRAHVRRFMDTTSTSSHVRALLDTPTGFDADVWSRMADQLGLQSLTIPEKFGGAGATVVVLAIALEEAGRALHSSPLLASTALATTAILASGDEAVMAQLLPSLADGSSLASLALTEGPGAWSNKPDTTAVPSADGYALTGDKAVVLDGGVADTYIVSARHGQGPGLFLVGRSAPGVTVTPLTSLDLTRRYANVRFDEAPSTVLGDLAGGSALIELTGQVAAVLLAAEQVGGAQAAFDSAVQHARMRVQFGQPIGMFQAIKHQCAEMFAAVEMAKATAYHAAKVAAEAMSGHTSELPVVSSIAKSLCSEVYLDVATRHIQILGGVGFTWEHDAHLHLRRAKASEAFLGTPSVHRAAIAGLLDV